MSVFRKPISIDEAAGRIRQGGMIAIVRGNFETSQLIEIARTIAEVGFTAMEVTLNSPGAGGHIAALSSAMGDRMLIGAGTVRTAAQVEEAISAGAQFLVSPGCDPASVARSLAEGVLHLPGVFTPSEAQQAAAAGARMLKLFPADFLGPEYLKAMRAPLDDVAFVPTGGVTPENAGEWRRAGAVAVALGSTLITGPLQTLDDLRRRASLMQAAWKGAAGD
jgi:2-dehydro-3-deoxyphosphogluconate aldolase/(4S)-4-hydroxy-2-oxoglutarate aldolase